MPRKDLFLYFLVFISPLYQRYIACSGTRHRFLVHKFYILYILHSSGYGADYSVSIFIRCDMYQGQSLYVLLEKYIKTETCYYSL